MPTESNTPDLLVAVASHLLGMEGPKAVTLRAVGAAAGVSRTAPYRHFEDKDDLLRAVATQTLESLGRAMTRGAADTSWGGTALSRACLGYAREALDHPEHYRLVFDSTGVEQPNEAMGRAADVAVGNFYDLVADAQREDGLIPGDVRVITAIVWSALHGMVSLTLTGHLHEPRMIDGSDRLPELIHSLVAGMTTNPAASDSAANLVASSSTLAGSMTEGTVEARAQEARDEVGTGM